MPLNSRQTPSPCRCLAPSGFPDGVAALRRRHSAEDRGDVVKGLAKIFSAPPRTEAERERLAKTASACVAWEGSASRLNRDETVTASQTRNTP